LNKEKIKKVFITEKEIYQKVSEIADLINRDYEGKEIVVIVILKGALFFAMDLVKKLEIPVTIDFMQVSSYGDAMETSGVVKIISDISENIKEKHCLIVEDIVDSGYTVNYLLKIFKLREPASVKICTFLNKKERRIKDVKIDYYALEVPDEFLIGYGLDYNGYFRNLPYVFSIKEEYTNNQEELL